MEEVTSGEIKMNSSFEELTFIHYICVYQVLSVIFGTVLGILRQTNLFVLVAVPAFI